MTDRQHLDNITYVNEKGDKQICREVLTKEFRGMLFSVGRKSVLFNNAVNCLN